MNKRFQDEHELSTKEFLHRNYLRKLGLGAASVVLSATAILGTTQKAKADEKNPTANPNQPEVANGNQTGSYTPNALPQGQSQSDYVGSYLAQASQSQTTLPSNNYVDVANNSAQINGTPQAVEANLASQNQPAAGSQSISSNQESSATTVMPTTNQPISDSSYQITAHSVNKIQGATREDPNYVNAHVELAFNNTSQIKNGDYLDIHLGIPMANGQLDNYNVQLSPDLPLKIGDTQIGTITSEQNGSDQFYRLIFNDQLANFNNVTMALDLKWSNPYTEDAIALNLLTSDPSINSFTPTNDLRIGNQTFASGLSVPVRQFTDPNLHQNQPYLLMFTTNNKLHVWTSDGQVQSFPVRSGVTYLFPDNMSHDFTVTVAALQSNLLETDWFSGDQVADEITDALQNYNATETDDKIAANPAIGTSVKKTEVPKVTVTVGEPTPAPKNSNYQMRTYHVQIAGNQPLKFGPEQFIQFATIQSKPGVDTGPSANITTYQEDVDAHQANNARDIAMHMDAQNEANLDIDPFTGQIYFLKRANMPDMANKDLQTLLSNNQVFWSQVYDNDKHQYFNFGDGDTPLYFDPNHPERNINAGGGTYSANNRQMLIALDDSVKIGKPGQNGAVVKGNPHKEGELTATIKYVDDDTKAILLTDSGKGLAGDVIKFNNDVQTEINFFERQGYTLVSTDFQAGQKFNSDINKNNFIVHFTKGNKPEDSNSFSQDLVFRDLDGNEIKRVKGQFTGKIGDTVTAAEIEQAIKANMPAGYRRLSGAFKDETISAASPQDLDVFVSKDKSTPSDQTKQFTLNIIYQTKDGKIVDSVPAITNENFPTTIAVDQINGLIDKYLPKGYQYVSGKLVQPLAISNSTPAPVVVTVEATNFNQDIIYQTANGTIVKTVPSAITGLLTNGQSVVAAADVNAKIDLNMPAGYDYISGKIAADEVVKGQTPTAIKVIVQPKQSAQVQFSQSIIYQTGLGQVVKTVPNIINGVLVNGQAQVSAANVNALIMNNMPQGYEYIAGQLTTDETVLNSAPAPLVVIVKAANNNPYNPNNNQNTGNGTYNPNPGQNIGGGIFNPTANNGYANNSATNPALTGQGALNNGNPMQAYLQNQVDQMLNHNRQKQAQSQQPRLPQTGSLDNDQLMAMALGLGTLLLSGGLADFDWRKHRN